MYATDNWKPEIIEMLLASGAKVNTQDVNGWTALMVAATHQNINSVINFLQPVQMLIYKTKRHHSTNACSIP